MRPPLVLTIAASDSDGASGLQSDLKTFTALGAYGASAATMICAVNTQGLRGIHYLPGDVVRGQIDAVATDLLLDATKIGALGSAAVVEAVAAAVREHRDRLGRLLLDPVMVGSDGSALISAEGARALRDSLVPLVDLLTPNMAEAAQLLGRPIATSLDEMREQALALQALGPQAVLVTGGRLEHDDAVDVLVHPGGTDLLRADRVPGRRVRGAGSTLSAAIAAQLARIEEYDRAGELEEIGEAGTDDDLVTIVASAREFLASAIENAGDWSISRSDSGYSTLNHLITLDKD
ncbi:bifunctional hydroxymethylpyrimidine kinase/phosphomethylpyrimidine kinase [Brachybacterium alimentarium]|uniref:Bifunctional hydroxymethylpyrimidine kinase/phosphomethylpyrimidine kinase n=1 Tax=Brachybacterium alimentarium TaxID=47845 RepID=A0A2A3YLD7_9MICO|nr:bifunctional hydroxymethylpyrimidine kinase/phosphomethylpyrimidine kinase [Brachybacterium alimentarium]PCC34722.1 bifunctional hydroxymethylpyrimidine kinase/phosphomethylpyrimidine kinase [Brachybacterium alimentarium]PCC40100.1 bifunctional hydroxymethylpyrimidine kinase/phosphomethylpyrimidine kinase [Brachybacterium alimentarium]RCS69425.1 bifunctional hydroxymethylpyrimidine kinase/phosphomethylpyrimidine kinase [Brachybacterium alimentarium]RCS80638.1 bifunctional hydroxymethylpyrimi